MGIPWNFLLQPLLWFLCAATALRIREVRRRMVNLLLIFLLSLNYLGLGLKVFRAKGSEQGEILKETRWRERNTESSLSFFSTPYNVYSKEKEISFPTCKYMVSRDLRAFKESDLLFLI